jgi:hypothetical protein
MHKIFWVREIDIQNSTEAGLILFQSGPDLPFTAAWASVSSIRTADELPTAIELQTKPAASLLGEKSGQWLILDAMIRNMSTAKTSRGKVFSGNSVRPSDRYEMPRRPGRGISFSISDRSSVSPAVGNAAIAAVCAINQDCFNIALMSGPFEHGKSTLPQFADH